MRKVTPDLPTADDTGIAVDHSSFADIRATPRTPSTPSTMFIVNPEIDTQPLLGFASESLAAACVNAMDLADRETGSSRNTLLGIAQIVMTAEISVNRALDPLEP